MIAVLRKSCLSAALVIFWTVFSIILPATAAPSINVMAPLLIGNPYDINSDSSQVAWNEFRNQLVALKKVGVHAISTDIWWGLIEANGPGQFNWQYYDKIAATIRDVGIHWVPILSFHQLGGNVGDVGFTPIPNWVWSDYLRDPKHFADGSDLMFRSEQGNLSKEYVSVWATDLVLEDYRQVMEAFKNHFASYADLISEINISLGPAGELRYPSYNSHDMGSGYPERGALQAYSKPAIRSFQVAMLKKYRTIERLNQAWNFGLKSFEQIFPPNPDLLKGPFWKNKEQFSEYGKDFFTWYNQSLIKHGAKMLNLANSVFGAPDSPFKSAELGAKIPGVHWRIATDRLAELAAGLIRTSYADWYSAEAGFGYRDILSVFTPRKNQMKRVLHFTALEMDDYRDGDLAQSRAKTLVKWMATAAHQFRIEIKGENALAWELSNSHSWDNMFDAITQDGYSGLTLLRVDEIIPDGLRMHLLTDFSQRIQNSSGNSCTAFFSK